MMINRFFHAVYMAGLAAWSRIFIEITARVKDEANYHRTINAACI
jgi:hypothetical protein